MCCLSVKRVNSRVFIFRRELQHFGVKISVIEPGYFRTGMSDLQSSLGRIKQAWEEVPMHIKEAYGQKFFDARELFFL